MSLNESKKSYGDMTSKETQPSTSGLSGNLTNSNDSFSKSASQDKNSPSRMSSLSRAEKILTALTTKFMTLLQESQNGVLDLRNVCQTLFQNIKHKNYFFIFKQKLVDSIPPRQKRRVYDITNVLEGIGLIEKYSKNSIRWY